MAAALGGASHLGARTRQRPGGAGSGRPAVSYKVKAVSSAALARPGQVRVRGLCGSAEAFLWNCPQGRVLQRLRVGVLAGLHEVVQVEVARDERRGLVVWLVQGQRLIPLKVAHNLLAARALAKALHLFYPLLRGNFVRCAFNAPVLGARVAQLGYLTVHCLRQPAHVVQVPLPLLGQPAPPQPAVEGPRLLQFSLALQQQLQVVTRVALAEPPEHLRLVAGFNGHHLAFHTSIAPAVSRS